jgi:hypothetical protein
MTKKETLHRQPEQTLFPRTSRLDTDMSSPYSSIPPVPANQPTKPKNGLGTAGFILGLLGLLFAFIPIIGVIAWPLVIPGLVFGGIGFFRARSGAATNKGLAISGLVLSFVGLVICIVWASAFSKAVNNAANTQAPAPAGDDLTSAAPRIAGSTAPVAPTQSASANHTVVYKVSGTGRASSITYTTDGMTTTNQESNVKLPWSKTLSLPTDQPLQLASVLAQGSGKGTIDVTIVVDGKSVKEAHADGYGVAAADANIGTLGG